MNQRVVVIRRALRLPLTWLLIGALIAGGAVWWRSDHQLSLDEKLQDLQTLVDTLENNYPYFEMTVRLGGTDWRTQVESFRDRIRRTESDSQFIAAVGEIVGYFGQGHTHLVDPGFYQLLVDAYSQSVPGYDLRPWVDVLTAPQVQARYRRWGSKFQLAAGAVSTGTPSGLQMEILQPERVAYIRVESFLPANIEADRRPLLEFLQTVRRFPYLVIDIRGNKGGSDQYWSENLVQPLLSAPLTYLSRFAVTADAYGRSFIAEELLPTDKLEERNLPPEVGGETVQLHRGAPGFRATRPGWLWRADLSADGQEDLLVRRQLRSVRASH